MADQGRRWRIAGALVAALLLGLGALWLIRGGGSDPGEPPPPVPPSLDDEAAPVSAAPASEPAAATQEAAKVAPAADGWTVRGRVWRRDAPGAAAGPAEGASVAVELSPRPGHDREPATLPASACGADGRFTVTVPLTWPAVAVRVEAPGAAPRVLRVRPEYDDERRAGVDVGSLLLQTGVELSLRLQGPEGEAISGGEVLLLREAAEHPDPVRGATIKEGTLLAQSRGEGMYGLERLIPGRYGALARAPGYLPEHRSIHVPSSEPIVFVLERGHRLAGTVRAVGGKPIGGAAVSVHLPGSGSIVSETTSTETGRFLADTLEDKPYQLTVEAAGYVVRMTEPVQAGTEDVEIVLEPGASLSGRVVGEANGAPVAAAIVTVECEERRLEAATDAAGRYALRGLPPGDHVLAAEHGCYLPSEVLDLHLEQGAELEVPEIRLPEGNSIEVEVVEEESGQPIAGAWLELSLAKETPRLGVYRYFGPTLADGSIVLRGLPSGVHSRLLARAEGHVLGALKEVEAPSRVPRLRLKLGRACSLGGRVVDADGRPVAEAIVWANVLSQRPFDDSWSDSDRIVRRTVRTDPDGRFNMSHLSPHPAYFLTALHEDFAPGLVHDLQVAPDAPVTGVEIRLERPGQLEGRIVDSEGRAVARARLLLQRKSSGPRGSSPRTGSFRGDASFRRVSAGADGQLRARGLAAGTWSVSARADGYLEMAREIEIVAGETAFLEGRLCRGEALSGRVLDQSGAPVVDAVIDLASVPGSERTDAGGRFRFPAVERGKVSGTARKQGYRSLDFGTEVPRDELVLRLERLARIEGRVKPLDGPLRGRLDILAVPQGVGDHGPIDGGADTETGEVWVSVPAGRYVVHVIADGFLPALGKEVSVAPGEALRDLTFEVSRGGAVRGRVLLEGTEEPVAGVEVSVIGVRYTQEGSPWRLPFTLSRADGSFELGGIPDGRIRLFAQQDKLAPLSLPELDVVTGRSADVTLLLGAGGSLRGRIVPAGGFRGEGWVAQVVPGSIDTILRRADADSEGRFTLEGLSPASSLFRVCHAANGCGLWFLRQATIVSGQQATADFAPPPLVPCRGRVVSGGEPVDQAVVRADYEAADGELTLRAQTRTGAAGEFELQVLPGVLVEVTAGSDGLPAVTTQMTFQFDSAPVELVLPAVAAMSEEKR